MKNKPHCEICGFLICDCPKPVRKPYMPPKEFRERTIQQKIESFEYDVINNYIEWLVERIDQHHISKRRADEIYVKLKRAHEEQRYKLNKLNNRIAHSED